MVRESVSAALESSAFPAKELQLRSLRGREAISSLFDFQVEVVSLNPEGIDLAKVVGAEVSIVLSRAGTIERRIHGVVSEASDSLATETDFRIYRLRVVPRMHRLTLVVNQEVNVDVSVPDLVKSKLDLVGLAGDVDLRLHENHSPREFVVQFAESDFAFVSRLTEHLGISYVFNQQGDKDRIVFADSPSGFPTIDGHEAVHFRQRGEACDVHALTVTRKVVPSVYAMRDYNYRTPALSLVAVHELAADPGGVDEFGAHAKTPAESALLARVRAEESDATRVVYDGKSDLAFVTAGARYRLEDHPLLANLELLVTEVEHELVQVALGTTGSAPSVAYSNSFRAIDAAKPFRPARVTPRPKMVGLYTGLTEAETGAGKKYAHIDEHGRYLVRLLFDTTGTGDRRRASHPIRLAQPHVGVDSGVHMPLHPGTEVVVAFVNGDPDRPIIVGALHNHAMPSVTAQGERTTNRIKTASGIVMDLIDGH